MAAAAAALAVAVALAGIVATASAHRTTYKSSTSFGYFSGNPPIVPSAFVGDVSSPKRACERGRKVKVFRKKRRGNKRIGRARSSSTGQWDLERNRVARGRYFARVKKKQIGPRRGHRHVCRAYKTSVLPAGG